MQLVQFRSSIQAMAQTAARRDSERRERAYIAADDREWEEREQSIESSFDRLGGQLARSVPLIRSELYSLTVSGVRGQMDGGRGELNKHKLTRFIRRQRDYKEEESKTWDIETLDCVEY